jgi:hypothetical protein
MKKSKFEKSSLIFSSYKGHRRNVKQFFFLSKMYKELLSAYVKHTLTRIISYHQENSKHQVQNNFKILFKNPFK